MLIKFMTICGEAVFITIGTAENQWAYNSVPSQSESRKRLHILLSYQVTGGKGPVSIYCIMTNSKKEHFQMAASISSEFTAAPFGASSDRSWEETSSIAEFNCAIFSVSIFRVFCQSDDEQNVSPGICMYVYINCNTDLLHVSRYSNTSTSQWYSSFSA